MELTVKNEIVDYQHCPQYNHCDVQYEHGGCPSDCGRYPDHQARVYRGRCGICGTDLFTDDIRFRRSEDEPYLCEECNALLVKTPCINCNRLFACDMGHNPSSLC